MSTTQDLHNLVSIGAAIALTAVANGEDVTGEVIDRQGSDGLEIILQVGAYTDGSVTPLVEESPILKEVVLAQHSQVCKFCVLS